MSVFGRKFGTLIILIAVTVSVSLTAYLVIIKTCSIRKIEVVGNGIQVVVDQKKVPKNLLFFPSDQIKKEILSNNPALADVEFRKKFPHTLVIKATLRTPVVRFLTSNGQTILLDRNGVVLTYGDQGLRLPVFRFAVESVRIGAVLNNERLRLALSMLDGIARIDPVVSVEEQSDFSIFIKTEKTGIYITQDAQPDQTIATLQTLIEGFRIKGRLPTVVDLRFDKPVVHF